VKKLSFFSGSLCSNVNAPVITVVCSESSTLPSLITTNQYKSSAVAEMGDRLATIDMHLKLGGGLSLMIGKLDPHVTQCGLGRGLP